LVRDLSGHEPVEEGASGRGLVHEYFTTRSTMGPGRHRGSPELAMELQEHVKRTTAPYKYPREVEFVTELPKTVSGKIRRAELRGALKSS
jgi:acyl-coenzyme A synthetase/AMP-(fatty) acid ligase